MTSYAARRRERTFVSRELELGLRSNRIITPSNINPWFGYWDGDAEFTRQQIEAVRSLGLDPATVERMDVFVQVGVRELWVPNGEKQPYRRVSCPIVQFRLDGRRKIVAPIGDRKLVYADGALRRGWGS